MAILYVLIIAALAIQVLILFLVRKKKRELKAKTAVLDKYKIKTRSDAFKVLSDVALPEDDREEIQKFYTTF